MQRGCARGSGVRGAADWTTALVVFDALSRQPRLAVFRSILRAGDDGVDSATLMRDLRTTGSALTLHLRCLAEAGLIHPRGGRSGKFVADLERLASALGVLVAERGQENA
jgi:ArsR family transcriptional regulator